MSLAQRIKQAREAKGLTQGDLASLIGVRQQMISKLERGESTKTSYILVLANILDVKPEWLSGIREEPAAYSKNSQKQSEIKATLQFLQLYCIEELEAKSIKEQLVFIEYCLKQLKKTKQTSKYQDVLTRCLSKL